MATSEACTFLSGDGKTRMSTTQGASESDLILGARGSSRLPEPCPPFAPEPNSYCSCGIKAPQVLLGRGMPKR